MSAPTRNSHGTTNADVPLCEPLVGQRFKHGGPYSPTAGCYSSVTITLLETSGLSSLMH